MTNEQNELAHYKKIFGLGDLATRAYASVVKIMEQQVEILNKVELKSIVNSDEKRDTIQYKNAKEIWEGMPDMVLKLNKLKSELGIEYTEKTEEYQPVSAKQIADGNHV